MSYENDRVQQTGEFLRTETLDSWITSKVENGKAHLDWFAPDGVMPRLAFVCPQDNEIVYPPAETNGPCSVYVWLQPEDYFAVPYANN